MLLMQRNQDGLERRLSVIGVPHYAIKPFIGLIVKWEQCSGVEWTIKRLKSLKVDLIRRNSGLQPLTWVRKNRAGDIYGVLGSIFRWSDKSEKNFGRAIQAFMAYSYYILPGLSESQKEKFLSSINPTNGDGLTDDFHKEFKRSVQSIIRRRTVSTSARPLVTYVGSPEKRAPRINRKGTIRQADNILDDLRIFDTFAGIHLYDKYQRLFKPLMFGIGSLQAWLDRENGQGIARPIFHTTPDCGEIHFLQEPGGKLRSIASPFRIYQEVLRPLGLEIYQIVKSLPWDCTFDQTKALPHIQSCLRQGRQVHSIDLSSATDHFPLSIQLTALRAIFEEKEWDHLDLFQDISRGKWKSELGTLQWTKGQPLGLYPSFGSFTLTHGLLLYHLANCDFHNQFFVVGDDVVILEDKLRNDYITMLERMSCPWSTDKSLSSSTLSEFAGKIVTPTMVIPQLKWRQISNENFLEICRLLGRKSRTLLSKRQRIVFDQVSHLCEPIGLNFSTPGDNLEKMVMRTLSFYRPAEVVLGSLMGLRKSLNILVHNSKVDFNASQLEILTSTFDEKVKSVMAQTIFHDWEFVSKLGIYGFESLPQALGLNPRLPLKEFQPSRLSTLDRYERILNRRNRN